MGWCGMTAQRRGTGVYAEIVMRIGYPLHSKTRDVPVWEPTLPADESKPPMIRATMYNAPAVQLLEDHISDVAARAKSGALHEARRLGFDPVVKMLEDPKRQCSVAIRIGEVTRAGSTDLDNATKLIMDGLVPAMMNSDAQVRTLRVDAAPSIELAKTMRMPTYVSVLTTPTLALLETAPQMFGSAFVFPYDLYEFSFTRRYREVLFPNVRVLNEPNKH